MSLFDFPRINITGALTISPGTANNDDYAGAVTLPASHGPYAGQTLALIDSKLVEARTYGMSDADFIAWVQKAQTFDVQGGGGVLLGGAARRQEAGGDGDRAEHESDRPEGGGVGGGDAEQQLAHEMGHREGAQEAGADACRGEAQPLADHEAENVGALRAERIVMESSEEISLPDGWMVTRARRYGGTLVTVAQRSGTDS